MNPGATGGRSSAPAAGQGQWPPAAGVAVVLLVLAVVLAACGASTAGSQGSPPGAQRTDRSATRLLVGARSGVVTIALNSIPTSLNDHTPQGDTEATRMVASAIWPQVFQVAPGLVPQLDTEVVQSAEVVDLNPQTVVYKIAPGAEWSDGVAISAADFVYAWQSERGGAVDVDGAPDEVVSTQGYRDIVSVTPSNKGRTVTVVFKTPFADWPSLFDDLLPAHIAETVGWNQGFDHYDPAVLVSGGPWKVAAWTPGLEIVLVRNPRWWGPRPRIGRIVFRALTNPAALASAVGRGQVQIAYPTGYDPGLLAAASSMPGVQTATSLGNEILQLEFNVDQSPFTSVDVRQGIAHDVNRAAIASLVGQSIDPLTWEDNNHLFANLQSGYSDNGAGYDQLDQLAASRLLVAGGLRTNDRGTWTWLGVPVVLHFAWDVDDPWSAQVGPMVAAQLVQAGFDVTTQPVSGAQLFGSVLPAGAFDLALVPVRASAYPSSETPNFSLSEPGTDTAQDWSGFDDPKVDALFGQAAGQLGQVQANATYQQIDQLLWQDMPSLPLFAEPTLVVSSAALLNVQDDPGALGPMWQATTWVPLVPGPEKHASSRQASGSS